MNWSQSSYLLESEQACLYLVPTPIGNLQDMTFRAIEILKQVDYIAAEDTRHTKKLLHFFQIEKRLVSYHEHNKQKSGDSIVTDLLAGKQIALVTDAGMPGISDPGEDLASLAIAHKIPVISLPGANAALTALIASGLTTSHFTFFGFLNRNKKKREEELQSIQYSPFTFIFYEAPHRLKQTLESMLKICGDRKGALVREISKKHEEYIRGTLSYLITWCEQEQIRGEFCIIISGNNDQRKIDEDKSPWWESLSLKDHVQYFIEKEYSVKEAIKLVAKERNVPKREVYQAYHVQNE